MRRNDIQKQVPAERFITSALYALQTMPADEQLTRAENLLVEARNLIADVVDSPKYQLKILKTDIQHNDK
jgi:hypothetical protein